MKKKSISSVELAALAKELQTAVGGKLSQIYHQEKRELILQLHVPRKGKQLLKIIPGKYLCLTETKQPPLRPTGFCMLLRKYISNASITEIYQYQSERILCIKLEKKDPFMLVFELFSKGNIVLLDNEETIIGALEQKTWKDRTVRNKQQYIFPDVGSNWKTITQKALGELLQQSERKNVATTLATELGLGGTYAEEACLLAEVDKKVLPGTISGVESKRLWTAIKGFSEKIQQPQAYFYENDITPFALEGKTTIKIETSYLVALDCLNPFQVTSPYEKKIAALQKTIQRQEEALVALEEKIKMNTAKGECVYEHYQQLAKLLEIVTTLRKEQTWQIVGEALQKERKITAVNLKKKSVTISL